MDLDKYISICKGQREIFSHDDPIEVEGKDLSSCVFLILAPHPDDESINGLLPLRLMNENKMEVINFAVTLGGKVERQEPRCKELENACQFLGIKNIVCESDWNQKRELLLATILKHDVRAFTCPHEKDGHKTHQRTYQLLEDVLTSLDDGIERIVFYNEFWFPIEDPNILIGANDKYLAKLMGATALHVGEVERNPYHLSLPSWMINNVRRASELLGARGESVLDSTYGTIYKKVIFLNGKEKPRVDHSSYVKVGRDLSSLLD